MIVLDEEQDGQLAAHRFAAGFQPLALAWTASEAEISYPRVLTLGASADYQIPRSDTILRLELAYDVDRLINDTSKWNGIDSSDVFLAAVGIDRPTYIPFLNPTRTAFLTFQTFVEHVMDYSDGGHANGMVVPATKPCGAARKRLRFCSVHSTPDARMASE